MAMYPEQGTLALSDEERQERFAFQPMLPLTASMCLEWSFFLYRQRDGLGVPAQRVSMALMVCDASPNYLHSIFL